MKRLKRQGKYHVHRTFARSPRTGFGPRFQMAVRVVECESGAKATALQKLARSVGRPGIREAFGVRPL